MNLERGLRLSLRALLTHRLRTGLVIGSVAMGVAAVLVTSALGQGAREEVMRDVAAMGTNLLVVRPGRVEARAARKELRGTVTTLRLDDCDEIAALGAVRETAPGVDRRMRVKAGRGSMDATVLGTTPSFFSLRGLQVDSGRVLLPLEDAAAERVAVLGARIAATLFPTEDPLGATLRIRGLPFEVVGVLRPRGVLADGSDEDGNVFIPIRTALRRQLNSTWLTSIFVSVADPARMDEAEREIRHLLRDRHRLASSQPDDFALQNLTRLLAMRDSIAQSLTLLSLGLAGVALLVGGTGVLALMLLSVKERTAEIGLIYSGFLVGFNW